MWEASHTEAKIQLWGLSMVDTLAEPQDRKNRSSQPYVDHLMLDARLGFLGTQDPRQYDLIKPTGVCQRRSHSAYLTTSVPTLRTMLYGHVKHNTGQRLVRKGRNEMTSQIHPRELCLQFEVMMVKDQLTAFRDGVALWCNFRWACGCGHSSNYSPDITYVISSRPIMGYVIGCCRLKRNRETQMKCVLHMCNLHGVLFGQQSQWLRLCTTHACGSAWLISVSHNVFGSCFWNPDFGSSATAVILCFLSALHLWCLWILWHRKHCSRNLNSDEWHWTSYFMTTHDV